MRFLVLILIFISSNSLAGPGTTIHEVKELNEKLLEEYHLRGEPYVLRVPYIPPRWDYGLEIGSYSTLQNNYWVGANVGRHVGTCIFTSSETCQQFVDGLIGIGGRESRTHFMLAPSLRWQFVNFPTYWSAMARVFAGGTSSIEPEGVTRRGIYGVGFGVTTYLHPRADLRFEARVGHGAYPFAQVFVSFQFKMDRWVEYFADRLQALGIGTVEATGTVIKGTVNATGDVLRTTVETTGDVIKATGSAVGEVVEKTGEATGVVKKKQRGEPKSSPLPKVGPTPSPAPAPTPTPAPAPKKP